MKGICCSTGYKKDDGFSYLTVKSKKKEERKHSRRASQ